MRFLKAFVHAVVFLFLVEGLHADIASLGSFGELLLGFRATGGKGGGYDAVFDLGSANALSSLSGSGVSYDFSGISSGLSITYGTNWWTRTDLNYGVIGADQSTFDFWLGRQSTVALGAPNNPSSLNSGILNSITSRVNEVQNVATTTASPPGSLFTNNSQILSVFPNTISGSLTFGQSPTPAWSYFSQNTDFSVTNTSVSIAHYSINQDISDGDAFAGNPAVDVGSLTLSNGIITLKPFTAGGGGGAGGSYSGPWNWTNGSGNWGVANNWASNQVASNTYGAGISGAVGGTITNNLVTNLSSLTFSNGAGTYTLTGSNIAIAVGITNNSAVTQTIDLSISGTGSVAQSGSGTMVLSRSNSYQGGTTLSSGAVVIGHNNSLGSGSVTVSGAASLIAGTANLSTTNAMAFNAATTIDTAANRWTNFGALSGSGSLTKIGSGTLTVAGSGSTFGGNTSVNAGALQVATGSSLGSGTVTVASGTTLSGSGTVGGVSLQSGGVLTGGVDGAVGKLILLGGMKFSAGGILNWKLANASGSSAGVDFDSFDVRGTLDLTGLSTGSTLQFNILNALGGTTGFLNNQDTQWLVASASSITGFSTNDFTISANSFSNSLAGGAFGFITNATGLYLKFTALGVDPWIGNLAAGSQSISGQTITSASNAVIGANSSRNGSVAVTNGGVWNVQGNLLVGGATNGSGTLTIGSGGRLTANNITISDQKGSTGLVIITNGASHNAISLGSGTLSFGVGNGSLQFAQSNAASLSNAISGKGMINSTGTGTTTLSGNQSGFTGTNYISSGAVVLGNGVTNGGVVNIAGKNASFNLNTNAVLSSTGTHAVAGTLLDNSGVAFKDSIKGSVALSPTGILQKTYAANQSVAGFGAGIGAGKSFSILAGTAASNGTNTPTLQAKIINGQLDFHGTTTNAIVMSMKDPSYSSIKNQIQWFDPVSKTWKNTTAGNSGNVTNAAISGMNGKSFAGSFDRFLLAVNVPVNLGLTDANSNGSLLDDLNGLSGSLINSTLAKIMGAFGYDNATKTSWAVINHNSIFGDGSATFTSADLLNEPVVADLSVFSPAPVDVQAVPEPETWALMVLGAGALILWGRRRKAERLKG